MDIIGTLSALYASEERWQRAVDRLAHRGVLRYTTADIAPLILEIQNSVLFNCEREIKEALLEWAWPQMKGELTRDVPRWYKAQLAKGVPHTPTEAEWTDIGRRG
jgi:hypothetical protein